MFLSNINCACVKAIKVESLDFSRVVEIHLNVLTGAERATQELRISSLTKIILFRQLALGNGIIFSNGVAILVAFESRHVLVKLFQRSW